MSGPGVLSFNLIEDAFPEGALTDKDGLTCVSAQWLHDFANNVHRAAHPANGAQADLVAKINALRVRGVNFTSGIPHPQLIDRAEVLALLGGAPVENSIDLIIDHIADNWPMKKYTLVEIEDRLRNFATKKEG